MPWQRKHETHAARMRARRLPEPVLPKPSAAPNPEPVPKPVRELCQCGSCRRCKQRALMRSLRGASWREEFLAARGIHLNKFTPEEDAALRRNWERNRYGSNAVRRSAKQLGRTSAEVFRRAVELGLIRSRERYRWTEEELLIVEEFAHLSADAIQKKLAGISPPGVRRTRAAIIGQIWAGRFRTNLDGLNVHDFCAAFGMSRSRVIGYITSGSLRARRIKGLSIWRKKHEEEIRQDGRTWYISTADICRFIAAHPGEIDLRKVTPEYFLDLFAYALAARPKK